MTHHLPIPKDRIEEFCRRWKVAELSARDDQEHAYESELGLFVRFDPVAEWNLTDRIAMQQELQVLSGRSIRLRNRQRATVRHGRTNAMQLLYDA